MSGIRKPAVIVADSMEEYMATPDPYKEPPKSKLNIYELGKYAERVGKKNRHADSRRNFAVQGVELANFYV